MQSLIRLFLVVSLCASQLAAQVHVVSHFQPDGHPEHACDHDPQDAECLLAQLTHSDEHHDEHTSEPQSIHNDCAMYHSYLSHSTCVPANSLVASQPVRNIAPAFFNSPIATQLATHNYAIRAPPIRS